MGREWDGFLRGSVRWQRLVLCALTALYASGGCSSSSPHEFKNKKPVHAVQGKVEMGGKPAAGAFVLFVPRSEPAENPDPRPRATVQPDGSFTLSTYGENDGAPAGDYKVTVTWEDPESRSDRFSGRYSAANSKLSATVKEGANEIPPIPLK